MKLTWTLSGMSLCYVIFVAPIFFCSIFGDKVSEEIALLCFILYWFQVIFGLLCENMIFLISVHIQLHCVCCQKWTVQGSIFTLSGGKMSLCSRMSCAKNPQHHLHHQPRSFSFRHRALQEKKKQEQRNWCKAEVQPWQWNDQAFLQWNYWGNC